MPANANLSQPQPESNFSGGISASARERADAHYRRAQDQLKLRNATTAVRELRDAIAIDPNNSQYHALLAKIHLNQGLVGMATISLRQALKLNPQEPLALECEDRLRKQSASQTQQDPPSFAKRLRTILTMKL